MLNLMEMAEKKPKQSAKICQKHKNNIGRIIKAFHSAVAHFLNPRGCCIIPYIIINHGDNHL